MLDEFDFLKTFDNTCSPDKVLFDVAFFITFGINTTFEMWRFMRAQIMKYC